VLSVNNLRLVALLHDEGVFADEHREVVITLSHSALWRNSGWIADTQGVTGYEFAEVVEIVWFGGWG